MDDVPAEMLAWIEHNLGGRVTRAVRQPRWRPAWDIDVECDGVSMPVYFRGDRGALDHGVYGLEHEQAVLEVLDAHGIPVPHVYGFCPEPRGIVMARVPGRANLLTATSDDDAPAVLDDYMSWLAKIHAIGTEPFARAGLVQEPGPAALADLDRWERTYRSMKLRPEPLIEFVLQWLRRNVPERDVTSTLAVGDSGQFLFAGAHITAVIDLELAFLGDPLHDLACMRLRDLAEPLGDLDRAFAHYERVAGTRIDRRALDYHTVRFAICTPMSTAHVLAAPPDEIDLVRYLVWYVQFSGCTGVATQWRRSRSTDDDGGTMVTIDELAAEVGALRVRLDAAEAVLAIHELKARYADLVDRRFWRGAMVDPAIVADLAEQIAGTFTPLGVWDGGRVLGVSRGRDEIAARMHTSTLTFSRHFFLKPHILVNGDRATGRWDVLSPCTTPDGTPHWMCGYEDDVYVRDTRGAWLHESMKMTTVFMAPAAEGWHRILA